jgi:hypothetical protein
MTLGELRPGQAFRAADGALWAVAFRFPSRTVRCYPCAGGPGEFWDAEPDTPAEPLDLPALVKERDELLGLVHDLLIDSEAERRGREGERGEVVRLLEGWAALAEGERSVLAIGSDRWQAVNERLALARALLEDVRARGPAATPLPPARLAERVKVLETAMRGLVDVVPAVEWRSGAAGPAWRNALARALRAARAALEGAGGKQPT